MNNLNVSVNFAGVAGQCAVFHFNGGTNGATAAKWSRGVGGSRRRSRCSSKREAIAKATSSSLEIMLDATILSRDIDGMSGCLYSTGCTFGRSYQRIFTSSTASFGSQGSQSWTTVSGLYQRLCFWTVNIQMYIRFVLYCSELFEQL